MGPSKGSVLNSGDARIFHRNPFSSASFVTDTNQSEPKKGFKRGES